MSLNITRVSGIDPISTQPLSDPIGPLPMDVARIIFQNLKTELPSMALVCKSWKALADDDVFRKMIHPIEAFGAQQWQECIGVDAGEEPLLPRRAYADMENGGHMLTFIPEKVTVRNEDEMAEEIALDNMEKIQKLVNCPKNGHKMNFNFFTAGLSLNEYHIEQFLNKKRTQEKPHWVLISKELTGIAKSYEDQETMAKNSGGNIPGLMDIVITVFMDYVRSGKSNFRPPIDDPIRCKESKEDNISLHFFPSSYFIPTNKLKIVHCLFTGAYLNVGFVLAKKFF